jgi:hypothetical protein
MALGAVYLLGMVRWHLDTPTMSAALACYPIIVLLTLWQETVIIVFSQCLDSMETSTHLLLGRDQAVGASLWWSGGEMKAP